MLTCPGCDARFEPIHKLQVYCTRSCKNRAYTARWRAKRRTTQQTTDLSATYYLPIAPIIPFLRRAISQMAFIPSDAEQFKYEGACGGRRAFARYLMSMYDLTFETADRMLCRVLADENKPDRCINDIWADRLAIALGLHPIEIWGDFWTSPYTSTHGTHRLAINWEELADAV